MKMYFAEQGHDWGCIIDSNPNMSTFALYDDGGVFDWSNRKSDKPVEVVAMPFGSCLVHYHKGHDIYFSSHQFICGGLLINCTGYGRSKKLSLSNLQSCRRKTMDEWYKDRFESVDRELKKHRGVSAE